MPNAVVTFDVTPTNADTLWLRPGQNLRTGESILQSAFGELTSLEIDLLTLAASIFACDLAFKRGEREEITRGIDLTVPVANLPIFNNIQGEIHYALYLLSHDAWRIKFTQRRSAPENTRDWPSNTEGKVLLFSGGLDSFSAALMFGDSGEKTHLVSHITANQAASGAQEILFNYLSEQYPEQFSRLPIRISMISRPSQGFPFPSDNDREDTQRTRSFLFLTLAAIYARRQGIKDVVVIAENGQLAIHLPLTAARISAFSTHTAHPQFVYTMNTILSQALGYKLRITNPFLYNTKSEVIKNALAHHSNMVPNAISCWKASRVYGSENHCGYCIPCLIRRIAIEANGSAIREYNRDLLNEDLAALSFDDEGKRNFVDLAEFARFIERAQTNADIEIAYPELSNPHIDSTKAINMYRRFANEARRVFAKYPNLHSVVQ